MECRKKEHVLYFTGEGPSANSSAPIQSQHFCLFGPLGAQMGVNIPMIKESVTDTVELIFLYCRL